MSENGNKFGNILVPDMDLEARQRIKAEATFLTFYTHLYRRGHDLDHGPTFAPHKGETEISVAAFYSLEGHGKNPINKAALELLPRISFKVYDEGRERSIDNSGLNEAVTTASMDQIAAMRLSKGANFIVARELGLQDSPVTNMLTALISSPNSSEYQRAVHINDLVGDILGDFNDQAVGKVDQMYEYTHAKGYVDFLDYLVDVKQTAAERVATVFAHEAQSIPPQV